MAELSELKKTAKAKRSRHLFMDVGGEFPSIILLASRFPSFSARILAYIGHKEAVRLYEDHFSGQDLQYNPASIKHGIPYTPSGRPMTSYSIGRGAKYLRLKSFPNNLFEKGHKTRYGGFVKANHVIKQRFKGELSGRIAGYFSYVESTLLPKWVDGK